MMDGVVTLGARDAGWPFREAGDPPPTGGERAAPCLEKHCD
jgi:hypothetical protein